MNAHIPIKNTLYSYKHDILKNDHGSNAQETKAPKADIELANIADGILCLSYPVQGIYNIVMH